MIRNWEEHGLQMDFGGMCVKCSDIDMIHVSRSGALIIGEIKNEKGTLKDGQRNLLSGIIDAHKYGGIVLYITHDKDVHQGSTVVNVAGCNVVEYYYKGKWFKPKRKITVNAILNEMEGYKMGATIKGRGKVWVKEWNGTTFYNMSVGSKDQNGNWINASQNIRFKKDAHPERVISNGTVIEFEGFATVSKGNDYNKVVWQITDFTIVGNEAAAPPNGFGAMQQNDIPF